MLPRLAFVFGCPLLAAGACSLEPIDMADKECPCAAEYTCDPRTKRCIIGNAVGGNGGANGGGTGSGGASGSAGAAGDASAGGTPAGGTSSGGASSGGTSSGGTSSGGTSSGGTSAGGASSGGAPSGGGGGGATDAGTPGSCVGNCALDNLPVPGSVPPCYCDKLCEGYGDCCADKIAICGKTPGDAGTD